MGDSKVRQLNESDVLGFKDLRLEALKSNPDAFGASFKKESEKDIGFFEERVKTSIVYGAYNDDGLIGVTCCLPDASEKCGHVANIWGVYLKKEFRGKGLAKNILGAVLDDLPSKIEQVRLSVGAHNEVAKKMYESFGFKECGYEERVLKVDGQYYDEILMVKFLGNETDK